MLHSLVTGGAGFIGSHLCERLLKEGHSVTAVDDFSTGSRANVAHLASNSHFELIEGSVLDEALMERAIARADRVFHLASAVGVRLIMEQPVKTIETIFNGSDVVLRHCAANCKRVVITSTSEVYGKGVSDPVSRRRRHALRRHVETPLGLRLRQGARRISGAGPLQRNAPAGGHRAVV